MGGLMSHPEEIGHEDYNIGVIKYTNILIKHEKGERLCVNNEVTQKWATRVTSHTVSLAISRGMVSLFHLFTNKMAFKVAKLGRTLVLFGSYTAFFQRTVSLCRSSPRQRFMSSESVATQQQQQQQQQERDPETQLLPTMIIFDLDDCLWSPEMHELWSNPSIKEKGNLGDDKNSQGVVGMKVPPAGPTVRLFPGARRVLRELATNPKYAGILLGVASSSLEPSYSHACLEGIEILPQLTMRQLIQYDQIGRTGPLSPDKRTHFRLLHQESNVPYKEMLFFDDCNWGDHCRTVSREFGVVSQRTPSGLQYSEFVEALEKYRREAQARIAITKE